MYLGNQTLLVNDALNLLRGKLVRFILEDGDMRMITNLVRTADELGLEYDPEKMVYRDVKAQEARAKSRAQLAKELEPGLNALFGKEYAQHDPNLSPEEKAAAKKQAAKQQAEESSEMPSEGATNLASSIQPANP